MVGWGTSNNKPRGDKALILAIKDLVYPDNALDLRVHVSKEDYMKGYVELGYLVDYYIHNPTLFYKFFPDKL